MNQEIVAVLKARNEMGGAINSAKRDVGGLQGAFKSVASTAGGFLAAGVVTQGFNLVRSQIGGIISGASDLAESQSKVNVVFGESAGIINEWASTSAQAMGQSKQQALEAVGTYGNLFQAFGVGRKESADMSKSLVQLAADLASFNNTSVDEALLALRSGLSGETEPLKRFGVAINEARLQEEAFKMGLIKTKNEALDPGVKAQAAYALIMHDTALAQGDFQRTSTGLANSQRILSATWDDLQAQLGTIFVPLLAIIVGFMARQLVPALSEVVGWITNFGEVIRGALTGDVMAAAQAFAALPPPLQSVALWLAANRPLLERIMQVARQLAEDVLKAWVDILKDVAKALMEHKEILIIVGIAIAALLIWMYAIPLAILAVIIAIGLLKAHWEEIWGAMPGPVKVVLELIWAYIQYVFESIRIYITFIMETIRNVIVFIMAILRGDWGAAWQAIKDQAAAVWQLIHDDIINKLNFIRDVISIFGPFIRDLLFGAFHAIENEAFAAWNGVKNAIVGPIQKIIDKIKDLIDWIGKIPSPGDIAGGLGDFLGGALPFNSLGTNNFRGGWTMVGETGPELMRLPAGSQILSARETAAMMRGQPAVQGQTRIYIQQLVVENGDVSSILAAVRR